MIIAFKRFYYRRYPSKGITLLPPNGETIYQRNRGLIITGFISKKDRKATSIRTNHRVQKLRLCKSNSFDSPPKPQVGPYIKGRQGKKTKEQKGMIDVMVLSDSHERYEL